MRIVIFCHPSFETHQSMPRYARMLADGMIRRGHDVEQWSPEARFHRCGKAAAAKKWLGYLDQFVVFPIEVRRRLKKLPKDTIFVLADQALGPWLPLVADRPHVVHCHDFLAQRSALGEIPENPVSVTGKLYQAFIRRGYKKGKYFISVSKKTRDDLGRFLTSKPILSQVVYNGLNQKFAPAENHRIARDELSKRLDVDIREGFILHVGGDVWYKNRKGVLEIYESWRGLGSRSAIPLLMIGSSPQAALLEFRNRSVYGKDIHFLPGIDDETVRLAYQAASVFLFPSLEEGFGWPIAEAMASGCPVITTSHAPMTEVAGEAAAATVGRKGNQSGSGAWAADGAVRLDAVLGGSETDRAAWVRKGLENALRFDPEMTLDSIENIYYDIGRIHRS